MLRDKVERQSGSTLLRVWHRPNTTSNGIEQWQVHLSKRTGNSIML